MSCKLFDIAAFWPKENIGFYGPKVSSNLTDDFWRSRSLLKHAVLLDATTLTDAWLSTMGKGAEWAEVYQRCLPPWENSFVFTASGLQGHAIGCHIYRVEDSLRPELERLGVGQVDGADSFWACRGWIGRHDRLLVLGDTALRIMALNKSGAYLGHLDIVESADSRSLEKLGVPICLPLFAFQLSHCRNMETVSTVHRPTMPRGKKNKSPRISFHTLQISESFIKGSSPTSSGESGNLPKHVCRGNFAHYTEEKKLFGKYTGMFWRPMHIRGSAKHGIVGKEYAMAEPTEQQTN